MTSDRTHGNAMKLHEGKFRLDIRDTALPERVVCHRNRWRREVMVAPSLSEFKQ